MKVLVLAAHGDDELLGPGGTLIRHARAGHAVHAAVCVSRPNLKMYAKSRYGAAVLARRKKQSQRVAQLLGFRSVAYLGLQDEMLEQDLNSTVTAVEKIVAEIRPDVVYLHHGGDVNQDHRGVFKAGLVALRGTIRPRVRRILAFETASTTEQAPSRPGWQFSPSVYVDIASVLALKLKALAVYDDELQPFPHPRSAEGLTALARTRGMTVGFAAAEAFELVREAVEQL